MKKLIPTKLSHGQNCEGLNLEDKNRSQAEFEGQKDIYHEPIYHML